MKPGKSAPTIKEQTGILSLAAKTNSRKPNLINRHLRPHTSPRFVLDVTGLDLRQQKPPQGTIQRETICYPVLDILEVEHSASLPYLAAPR